MRSPTVARAVLVEEPSAKEYRSAKPSEAEYRSANESPDFVFATTVVRAARGTRISPLVEAARCVAESPLAAGLVSEFPQP